MAQSKTNDLERLQRAFARPERISDGAMLAGSALVTPLLAVRQRQARMEAARTRARLGAKHPDTKAREAQAAALAERASHLATDIERQRLVKPQLGDQAGLYGRVTRDGVGVPGFAVWALDAQGEALVHGCTGHEGDYTLSFVPDQPVLIEVRDADRTLWRDDKGRSYPPYRAIHRDIELNKARPLCPEDRGEKPPAYAPTVQVPNLVGAEVDKAIQTLEGLGLKLGKRTSKKAQQPGLVLDQNPAGGTTATPGASVDLVVSTADDKPAAQVRDLTGKSLHQAMAEMVKAGAMLGTVNISGEGGRTPLVQSAKPDDKGERVDLHIKSAGGDALLTQVIATVLATTAEATELALEGKTGTAEWLKKHKLTNIEQIGQALALEDAALRKRLRLKAGDHVGTVRSLLQAAISRVRKV